MTTPPADSLWHAPAAIALPTLFDDATARVFLDEVTALTGGVSSFATELVVCTLSGGTASVQTNIALAPGEAEGGSHVVVAFTDLPERTRLEQALHQASDRRGFPKYGQAASVGTEYASVATGAGAGSGGAGD